MDPSNQIVRFASMDWRSPAANIRQKVSASGSQQIRLLELRRGLEHPEWCMKGHVGYVLEGSLTLEFEDSSVELSAGDGLIIPGGAASRHKPKPTSDRVVLILFEQADS